MAGFTCELCGGKIKMQANKTGVCQGCGMEYDFDAMKAMAGNPTEPTISSPAPVLRTAQSADANEVDRNALITYLDDLRVMESIKAKNNTTADLLSKKRDDDLLEIMRLKSQYEDNKEPRKSSKFLVKYLKGLGVCNLVTGGLFLLMGLAAPPTLPFGIFMIILGVVLVTLSSKKKDKIAAKDEKNMEDYKNKSAELESEIKSKSEEYDKMQEGLAIEEKALGDENREIDNMLQKAYSANIIPQQFRNIEGVYYLYDYLSTSNQSLSEALMQANLEAIKQKLDNMIKLQSTQIVEQRITNAKLGKVVEYSEATMNNTAVAAQYAKIVAINSELNLKLTKKQLAYQRAEFWLS